MVSLIGKGSYACVFHPDVVDDDPRYVSKVFIDLSELRLEKRLFDRYLAPNNEHNTFVRVFEPFSLRGSSSSSSTDKVKLIKMNCHKIRDDTINGIKMDYVGPSIDKAGRIERLFKNVRLLCLSLDTLHRNGVAHRDIKPANILYGEKEKICKIIDAGLMCGFDEFFEGLNAILMQHQYPFYPPEFRVQYGVNMIIESIGLSNSPFNADNKDMIINVMGRPECVHDMLLFGLMNRDPSYSFVGNRDRANLRAFYVRVMEAFSARPTSDVRTCLDVMKEIFRPYHYLVDVYSLGCCLHTLYLKQSLPEDERRRLMNMSKRFTHVNPIKRDLFWKRYLRKPMKNDEDVRGGFVTIMKKSSSSPMMKTDLFKDYKEQVLSEKKMHDLKMKNLKSVLRNQSQSGM